MRHPPADFDVTVKAALDEAKARIAAGDLPAALAVYRRAWDASSAAKNAGRTRRSRAASRRSRCSPGAP